jgi:hypothetical protein
VGCLTSGLIVICVVAGGIIYYFNERVKKRYEALRKWTLVVPDPNRDPIVSFDLVNAFYVQPFYLFWLSYFYYINDL